MNGERRIKVNSLILAGALALGAVPLLVKDGSVSTPTPVRRETPALTEEIILPYWVCWNEFWAGPVEICMERFVRKDR